MGRNRQYPYWGKGIRENDPLRQLKNGALCSPTARRLALSEGSLWAVAGEGLDPIISESGAELGLSQITPAVPLKDVLDLSEGIWPRDCKTVGIFADWTSQ